MRRINVKPTWPLGLSFLGLGREHLIVAGSLTALGVWGAMVAILRPGRWREVCLLLPICFSPPVLFGMERGNDDLVYFLLLSLVPIILNLKTAYRFWMAWALIFLLAPAKYYPGAVFLVFFLEVKDWRLLVKLLVAGILFVGAYVGYNYEEILYLKENVPKPNFLLAYGGRRTLELWSLPPFVMWLLLAALVLVVVYGLFRRQWPEPTVSLWSRRWFLLGYSVTVFCFILNSNYDYRLIFVLPMLPCLLELSRNSKRSGLLYYLAVGLLCILPIAFWSELAAINYAELTGTPFFLFSRNIKGLLLWGFVFGATVIATTILRPNVRDLCGSFLHVKKDSLDNE